MNNDHNNGSHSDYKNGFHKDAEWMALCQQAAVERDPEKLLALTREINRLLKEREDALKNPAQRP